MRIKTGLALIAACIALLGGTAREGHAYGSYGTVVNNFCAPVTPYTNSDCALCHVSNRATMTPAMTEYNLQNYRYFCPLGPPPTANAGPSQTAPAGATVTLNGSGSTGTIASYAWTQTAGPAVTLTGATTSRATFVAPFVGASGAALTFQLTVRDSGGQASSATTVVNVTYVNRPPVAHAGAAQTVTGGRVVTLDGSGSSDPDGGTIAYSWAQAGGPAVTLANPTTAKPTFTSPAVDASGATLTFRLTVTDSGSLTATATTTVSVTAVNQPPTANAGANQAADSGATVTLDGSLSSDPDGTIASFLWTQTSGPTVTLTASTTAKASFVAPAVGATGATLTFQLTVTDNGGLTATSTVTVSVNGSNVPPTANAGGKRVVRPGAPVTLDGSQSSDADGRVVSYSWSQIGGLQVPLSNPTTVRPTFVAPSVADDAVLALELTVTDNAGFTGTDLALVTVSQTMPIPKSVDLAASPASPQPAGTTVTFTARPYGPSGPYEYRFSLQRPGRAWSVVRQYSTATSWRWNTHGLAAGSYSIRVEMRKVGSTVASEATKTVTYALTHEEHD